MVESARRRAGVMMQPMCTEATAVLDGVRGGPPVDRRSVARLISAVSVLGAAARDRLAELDLNPVMAAAATAVDWLIITR